MGFITRSFIVVSVFLFLASLNAKAKNIFYINNQFANLFTFSNPSLTTAGSGKTLLYYGGPIIAEPKIQVVFWNDNVDPSVIGNISDFYIEYLKSPYMSWLTEYSTVGLKSVEGREGTNQIYKEGRWIGEVMLKPSTDKTNLNDQEIQAEIVKQIDLGTLPKPDENTVYMMHFPQNISIDMEGMKSCDAFGGYHYFFKNEKYGNIFYAVMPECVYYGKGGIDFATQVSAHELFEAVTDAMPTDSSSPAYPQAWNNYQGYEISDICGGAGKGSLQGAKRSYSIPKHWSNAKNSCILTY